MLKTASKHAWFAILAASSLTGCSSSEESSARSSEQPREFSAEDKRAARALSISNNPAVINAESAYARALLCRNGIGALADQFEKARGLSDEQRQAVERARAHFDEQLRALGHREGKSESDMRSDLETVAQENVDAAENARIANACLRRLLEAA